MNKNRLGNVILTTFIPSLLLVYFLNVQAASSGIFSLFPIEHYDQNISNWILPTNPDYRKPLLTPKQQAIRKAEIYFHYFGKQSPWNAGYIREIFSQQAPFNLRSLEEKVMLSYSNDNKSADKIMYGANFRPYTKQSFEPIKNNIHLEQFNEQHYDSSRRAIAVVNIQARALPTDEPYFYSNQIAGEGYPFDNAQAGVIWAGAPLYVLGETVDHLWDFVLTPSFIGWVKQTDIAYVNSHFIAQWTWTAQQQMATMTRTAIPIKDIENGISRFAGYIGMILPAIKSSKGIEILIPVKNAKQQAHIYHAKLNTKDMAVIPLLPTPEHFVQIIQQLLGRPYGWGGMYFYSDCSSELKNIYGAFGIWLPMHSSHQVDPEQVLGKAEDLSALNVTMRSQYLMKQGHPWMTIIHVGGHVILYLGNYPNPNDPSHGIVPLSYQDMWGLGKGDIPYRSVIGQAVLFPLLPTYPEDPALVSQLNHQVFQLFYLDNLPEPADAANMLNSRKVNLRFLLSP